MHFKYLHNNPLKKKKKNLHNNEKYLIFHENFNVKTSFLLYSTPVILKMSFMNCVDQ